LKDKGRRDYTLNSTPRGPTNGVQFNAALVGFDRREAVTIPPLPDAGQWERFNAARQAMLPNFANERAAARYRTPNSGDSIAAQ
jgi:hypothetical protein